MTSRRFGTRAHAAVRVATMEPSPADGWVAETYRLIDAFECERRTGHKPEPVAPFLIAASDYLWRRYQTAASWERFEVDGLFTLFRPFLSIDGWADQCIDALREFFGHLQRSGMIDARNAARIARELELARKIELKPAAADELSCSHMNRAACRAHARSTRRGHSA